MRWGLNELTGSKITADLLTHDTVYRLDLSTGRNVSFGSNSLWNVEDSYYQINDEWYRISKYGNTIYKFNMENNQWDTLIERNAANAYCVHDNELYYSNGTSIYKLEQTGRFGKWESFEMLNSTDIKVKDGIPFSSIDAFVIDNRGDVVFVDSTHNLLRKITLN